MNSTSPKSSLVKLGLHTKQRPIRIMVVGTSGVGKTGNYYKLLINQSIDVTIFIKFRDSGLIIHCDGNLILCCYSFKGCKAFSIKIRLIV